MAIDIEALKSNVSSLIKRTIADKSGFEIESTEEPKECTLMEYQGRMRTSGLEKFNGPCFVVGSSLYLSENDITKNKAKGAIIFYLEPELAEKLLKKMGFKYEEDDDESFLEAVKEFGKFMADEVKESIASLGSSSLIAVEPVAATSNIASGLAFDLKEYSYYEFSYTMFKKKSLVAEITIGSF